jgi:hypothetical protein
MNIRSAVTRALDWESVASWSTILILAANAIFVLHLQWFGLTCLALCIVLALSRKNIVAAFDRGDFDPIRRYFSAGTILCVLAAVIGIVFFMKFPAAEWNQILFHDDFTSNYAESVKGAEALMQGGMFGWDSRMLGGYPMAFEISTSRAWFLLPFSLIMGPKIGYHAMIFLFYMVFPFLCYWYARIVLNDRGSAAAASAFASLFLVGLFRNYVLLFGTTDILMGLNFFVLNLILYEKMKTGSRWAPFLLSATIPLTMYAHLTFFICSVVLISVQAFLDRSPRLLARTAAVLGFAFLMTLHYSYYLVVFHGYLNGTGSVYDPASIPLKDDLKSILFQFLAQVNPFDFRFVKFTFDELPIRIAPIVLLVFLRGSRHLRRIVIFVAAIWLVFPLQHHAVQAVLLRTVITYALFLSVVLGHFLKTQMALFRVQNLLLLPLLFAPCIASPAFFRFGHIDSIKTMWPGFHQVASRLDGNMVLLENVGSYNIIPYEKVRSQAGALDAHWESLVSYELNKRLFSNTIEGYHLTSFRGNMLSCGVYQGYPIEHYKPEVFSALFKKWGIRYLVLWSNRSKQYFAALAAYRPVWSDGDWVIAEYLEADPRSVVVEHGEGRLEDQDYFAKRISLSGVSAGDTVVVRQNFFPTWKAYFAGKRVPVVNHDRQLGLIAPSSGSYDITMRFPKYHLFSVCAAVSLILSFFAFRYEDRMARALSAYRRRRDRSAS